MRSIVTVTVPAASIDLTTLDRMKSELGITDGSEDVVLGNKIAEASSDIAVRCWPSLKRETLSETFWPDFHQLRFDHRHGGESVSLSRFPVVSVASVTLDGTALDSSLYRLDAESGLLYRLDASGYPLHWRVSQSLVVVYAAGFAIPSDETADDPLLLPGALQAACIDLVASYWASKGRDPNLRAEAVEGVASYQYWVGAIGDVGELPPSVEAKIAPYKRTVR